MPRHQNPITHIQCVRDGGFPSAGARTGDQRDLGGVCAEHGHEITKDRAQQRCKSRRPVILHRHCHGTPNIFGKVGRSGNKKVRQSSLHGILRSSCTCDDSESLCCERKPRSAVNARIYKFKIM